MDGNRASACRCHRICERSVGDVSDQLAMPGQQRLWGDDGGDLGQRFRPKPLALAAKRQR